MIFFAGRHVARYGDIIAEKTGLGGVWIGVVLISLLTSLPELITGVSATVLVDAPDLMVGNIVGANAFNMLNLAVLDMLNRNGSLLHAASPTHNVTGWFGLLLLFLLAGFIFISLNFSPMALGWVGYYTPALILLYLLAVRLIFVFERGQELAQETGAAYAEISTVRVYLSFTIAAVFIVAAGVWLALIGDEIAMTYNWAQSFVGSLFLAFTTTLPELTVSFTAMRMGAHDLAVANMLGSNLFNITVIPLVDILYTQGPILANVSPGHLTTAAVVMVMTLVCIASLRFRVMTAHRVNIVNVLQPALFLTSAYLSFVNA